MRIDSSTLQFESSHSGWAQTLQSQASPGALSRANRRLENLAAAPALPDIRSALADISAAARQRLETELQTQGTAAVAADDATAVEPMLALLKSMIEAFTGEAIDILSKADWPQARPVPSITAPPPAGNQTGSLYLRRESYESVQMSARGSVRTNEGLEIEFSLELSYERYVREEVLIQSGPAPARKDPLVLNFAGNANMLLDQLISFDLNSDGTAERLPGLAPGVAFLAFDRNGNGRIDDGGELFGPATNNGFEELTRLDDDANGWIDEADDAFKYLSLWRPGNQASAPQDLAAAGIGALALARAQTPFMLGQGHQTLGALRESGLFLTESGTTGLLQEIDLEPR